MIKDPQQMNLKELFELQKQVNNIIFYEIVGRGLIKD